MNHSNEGLLQAYMDGELEVDERVALESHLAGCLPCRAELKRMEALSEEFSGALLLLGAPALSRPGGPMLAMPSRTVRVWAPRTSALPRAAALVFLVAGAAAAAIPGSPLYDLLRPEPEPVEVAVTREPAGAPAPAAESRVASEAAPAEAGVSIEPVDGAVTVILRDAAPGLRIRAMLSESSRAGVFATGAAASARFDAGPGRIEVVGIGAGDLRIEIPQSARSATVVVNGRESLVKNGSQLQLTTPAGGAAGAEVTFRP